MAWVPDIGTVIDVAGRLESPWQRWRQRRARQRLAVASAQLSNPHMHAFMQWKYGDYPLLERCQHRYPVAVYRAPMSQRSDVDSVLCGLDTIPLAGDKGLLQNDVYRQMARLCGLAPFNRQTFAMRRITCEDRLEIMCDVGSYFATLDTCDSLEWETLWNARRLCSSDRESLSKFDQRLTLRRKLHQAVSSPVLDGSCRCAGVAISTLIACYDNDELYLLLRRRGSLSVAVHLNLIHVLPSFMFQPATVELQQEFSVIHNIYREYLEELFDREEPGGPEVDARYFYGDPRLKYLVSLIEDGQAELFLCGIAVSLLNLRPEICTLLLIRSPEWYERHSQGDEKERFRVNKEFVVFPSADGGGGEPIGRIRFRNSDAELGNSAPLGPSEMVPAGAAAFWLGVDMLREVL